MMPPLRSVFQIRYIYYLSNQTPYLQSFQFLERYQASKKFRDTKKNASDGTIRKKKIIENFFDESDVQPLDGENVADDSVGYKPTYQQAERLLLKKLRSCVSKECNGKKNCAINKYGVHTEINYSQIHAWAAGMVSRFSSCLLKN